MMCNNKKFNKLSEQILSNDVHITGRKYGNFDQKMESDSDGDK